ncbi:glycosyltransferase family 39 protein [Pengzhenrongella sp.]|jgi:4-amino-4-deoxy-L-arabinose transferase-like glycosyltransferase|uniref:glycosyltransferase family 39 protein n=1 Tax=Pengzhenrongella sp. TaxID=2888820 RepID=UPI002F93D00D
MSTLYSDSADTLLTSGSPDAAAPSSTTDEPPSGTDRPPSGTTRPPRTRWERPALAGLLLVTAALYLWDLSVSGWGNSFYSAAVQAGSESWKAFLYGASDAAGSITVDKPPAALWIMALSVRIFGLSSWSILVPEALMGVATVGVLYASVRRRFSPQSALLAGGVLALTPVAALMFRFNNPDALLVLLMTLAAYATLRAIEDGRTRWMVVAGALIGLGFLTKQLQAFLVLPGFAAAFLIAAPGSLWKRVRTGLLSVGAMVLTAGWWVALVELVPASMRPYVGGSTTNSFLELTFGYNGLGRLTGNETGGAGGGGAGTAGGMWGATGLGRLFSSELGGQIAWLIPAALVLGAVALWLRRRFPRTDAPRAALIVWGSWLVVTGLTFSLMAGTFHAYYTVALAPAIAALVGIGASLLWERRAQVLALAVLAAVTLGTSVWAFVLLDRSADWLPALRWAILVAGALGAAGLLAGRWLGARVLTASAIVALAAALAGPTAYTVQTVTTAHAGSIVTAGPAVAGGTGGMGGGPGGAGGRGFGGHPPTQGGTGTGTGTGTLPALPSTQGGTTAQGGTAPQTGTTGTAPGGMRGGMGGDSEPSQQVTAMLLKNADNYTWVAATVGATSAAGYQLATEKSVMPIGGFTGGDPSPTLARFKADVAAGEIHYFIGGGQGGGRGGSSGTSSAIAAWVTATFTAQTVDGVTIYDLTQPASTSASATTTGNATGTATATTTTDSTTSAS